MAKKKMVCGGSFNKKDDCGREFFYSLREEVNEDHKSVTVVFAVDKSGCPIKDGNLIVLPHDSDSEMLFCDNVNECLDLDIGDGGVIIHDESCIGDNDYIG
jgi:hypothetical protein